MEILTCSVFDGYVLIHIDGSWPSQPNKLIEEIYNFWEKAQQNNLLLDLREMQGKPTLAGDYFDAKVFEEIGFKNICKIAVIDQIKRKDDNDFFELTASNRGLKFRFFYENEQKAIDWLRTQE